ncbi:HDOD domain-containing protein [Paludibacterium yongneupense]|uniref:HDOD domain-containing protein n=1 Tax=Paludibacterium yongneupense TaxID=400061 RepID=UPI000419FBBD|nr:HDOD domain-containing protein [Paludibacterium yongneupense]
MYLEAIFEKASGRLPMIPKVVQELIASFQRQDTNAEDISDKVGHDQVLSARVLRMANSARFGYARRIGSLEDAVMLLGFDNLRVVVIASGVSGLSSAVPGVDMLPFWQRSFAIATTARSLAGLAGLNGQLAYTCGLLANIGELVLHVAVPEEARQIDQQVAAGSDRYQTEQERLGFDLAQVGAELARRWDLPETIQHAIRRQHELDLPDPAAPYATLCGLASLLVTAFLRGQHDEAVVTALPTAALAALEIDAAELREAIDSLAADATRHDALL